jgi:hypothetical protein
MPLQIGGQLLSGVRRPQVPQIPQATVQPPVASAQTSLPASNNLWSQYQSQLAPITQQSQSLLKDYLALQSQLPTFEQRLLDSIKQAGQYPSAAAMREEYIQNPNLTPMAIEALVSQRGQSTRGTIQDIINRAYGGFEADVASRAGAAELAQQQRANLLEEYGLEYQAQQDALTAAYSTKQAAIADAEGGLNAENFARKYGGTIDDWELINIYNQNSPYGVMKESPQTFKEWTGGTEVEETLDQEAIAAYVSMIDSGEITLSNVPQAYRAEVVKRTGQVGFEEETPGLWERLRGVIGL